jgi:hypothetical protein
MASSPTVRRRRLSAELRRLRGNRTGGEVSRGVGWSATKISRAESGRESLPPSEIEKLIDFYGVTDPLRARLLELAEDAAQRGWWEDFSDDLTPEYAEFIGLETEATSSLHWAIESMPGLLQTEDYIRELNRAYRRVDTTTPPGAFERSLQVRMRRQERLSQEPVLHFSAVIDEGVLLRKVGDSALMHAQLTHLLKMAELPNVELRVQPLERKTALLIGSFVILTFASKSEPEASSLSDVVSTENLNTEFYIEGEADTHLYRQFFNAISDAALTADESKDIVNKTLKKKWS